MVSFNEWVDRVSEAAQKAGVDLNSTHLQYIDTNQNMTPPTFHYDKVYDLETRTWSKEDFLVGIT